MRLLFLAQIVGGCLVASTLAFCVWSWTWTGREIMELRRQIDRSQQHLRTLEESIRARSSLEIAHGASPDESVASEAAPATPQSSAGITSRDAVQPVTTTGVALPATLRGELRSLAARERLKTARTDAERLAAARELVAEENSRTKYLGVREMLRLAPDEGLDALRDLVKSELAASPPNWTVLDESLMLMRGFEGRRADLELRSYYATGEPRLQVPAARLLAERGDPSLLNDLFAVADGELASDRPEQRMAGIVKLARSGTSSALPHLEVALADRDVMVRVIATQALGMISGPDAVPYLERMLKDPSAAVRDQAVTGLTRLSGGRSD
jgi:hypothetical protein